MDAKELRIGCWVMDPLGTYMQVEQIGDHVNSDYVAARSKNGSWGQNLFEPIPLTPEILEKAGAYVSKIMSGYVLPLKGKTEIIRIHKTIIADGYYWEWGTHAVKLGHLHQLQNLYFALTGEELNIEL